VNLPTGWDTNEIIGISLGFKVPRKVLVFPHPLFGSSKFHGISLVIAPVTTGFVMSRFGAFLRKRGKRVVQVEMFPNG
jgi:hypothetical protein